MTYKTRTHSTHALIFGGKLSLAPRRTGRLLAGKSRLPTRFSSLNNELAVKSEKKHLVHRGGKGFLVIM